MLSDFIIRSTAAIGGTPFRFNKCTALSSAGSGAAFGGAAAGVPGALVGGALGIASSLIGGLFGKHNTDKTNQMNYLIMKERYIVSCQSRSFLASSALNLFCSFIIK